MSDDIKAALKRLTATVCEALEMGLTPSYIDSAQFIRDTRLVASAYLAEHDETPITEEWLRSVGFDGLRFDNEDQLKLRLDRFWFTKYGGWNLWWAIGSGPTRIWERLVDDVKTRGQLRMIATVHSIPLTESGATNG